MKPSPFLYKRARSVDEAVNLLRSYGDEAKLLAGGQSLLAGLNFRLSSPTILIDIAELPLRNITQDGEDVVVGALVTHSEVESSPHIRTRLPLAAAAMPHVAHIAIRNRGTFGGSLAYADPAAEWPAIAVALRCSLTIAGASGERSVPAEAFFKDLFTTDLAQDEIIVGGRFPAAPVGRHFFFDEVCRRHGDFAAVGLAATSDRSADGSREWRLVFFGAGSIPAVVSWRDDGRAALTEADVRAAGDRVTVAIEPSSDLSFSAETKRHLARSPHGPRIEGDDLMINSANNEMNEDPLDKIKISLQVNGKPVRKHAVPRQHAIDYLREELDLTGSHVGCEHGVCGACTIMVDEKIVRGCLALAVQLDGHEVWTVEGLGKSPRFADLQQAFHRHNALQCGFCTPGMLIAAYDLVNTKRRLSREDIRLHMSGNFCRCTGYQVIIDAIADWLEHLEEQS